ncbi:MAG: biopolymer transporter ExbD [bacterium]|nr:biopolymer transporter ExbD [bacterium]
MSIKRTYHEMEIDEVIDLTPMVNIALILVIVFLCVSPMALITGIKAVNSGNSGNKSAVTLGKSSKDEIVKLILEKDGTVLINGIKVEQHLLIPYLKDTIMMSPKKEVMITADKENKVQEVVTLLDLSKQNGATKVILAE